MDAAPQAVSLSLIIPVFNRPQEIDELLASLTQQTNTQVEVIVVEDGSSVSCKQEVEKYQQSLNVKYFSKPNSGPGQSRNYGAERATGNYVVYLDSDCLLPPHYVEAVLNSLTTSFVDAYGGPDKAHESFTVFQKAVNYSMTSFLTTGGIRGGGEKLDKFYPRSFNMGYSKQVFEQTGGFGKMRFGEDIDMSIRILKAGFKTRLIKEAYVFHKRRTSVRQFFKQVHNSGIARINLYKTHPGTLKLVHFFPSLFTLGVVFLLVMAIALSPYFILPLLLYTLLLFLDATIQNKRVVIGLWAVVASYVQLMGYGTGFIIAFWKRLVLGQDEFHAFQKNFYK